MIKNRTRLTILLLLLLMFMMTGCGGQKTGDPEKVLDEHLTGTMQLDYAEQFHVSYYDGDIAVVDIEDGLRYLVTGSDGKIPDWFPESLINEMTVIKAPAGSVYLAASSAMDLIDAAGGIDAVKMTSTRASDWGIDKIRELVESDRIHYVGKYRAPDYEALLEGDIDLAIESTMIYHSPQVKEEIEELDIPVLVERSSYENDPLGRLEWIKLYGLLLGREDEAAEFFDQSVAKVTGIDTDAVKDTPSVAFFSVSSNGSVVVRKPGDYVTRMIEMAGGTYVPEDITDEEDNALSTMNMQMEAFYDKASDADILIYNSTIEGELETREDLIKLSDKFADFKAVKEGRVWCTDKNVFQKTTGVSGMIVEMNMIFAGAEDDTGMEYFHLLK